MSNFFDGHEVVWNAGRTQPKKIRGAFALPRSESPLEGVKQFLRTHEKELALPYTVRGLRLARELETPIRHIYRFEHTVDDIPVFGAELLVQVDKQARVRQIDSFEGRGNVIAPTPGQPQLSADQAREAALVALGRPALRLTTPAPREVYFPTDAGLRKAYEMVLATADPHDWQLVVDAYSGQTLSKRDLIKQVDGTGKVFDPNPVVTANNNGLRDPSATVASCGFAGSPQATIDAQRVTVTLRDLTLTSGVYRLDGPYCRIHNFAAPASTIPTEASGNFNYASNDERFEAVMVYYHIDSFQRYLRSLGITTAHPGVIECDPHDNSITAAWYSSADGGLHFSDSGACKPDRAEDADCMIHEYGHAIQDSQVPGWGGMNPVTHRDEAGAMGEGFGDFIACAYFADRGGAYQREVFEDWVFAPAGLRRVDGTKVYPGSWVHEVHSDGEIWSAALWNIYRAIGGDSAVAADREAARAAMFRSVIHSHPMLTTTASMPEGAEAIMVTNAELEEYRGKHLMQMLDSFHDRGILPIAAGADLFVRDDLGDPGTEAYHSPTFYDSPDIWVRNHDDDGTTHQSPEAGHDNWFYARITNRGTEPARALVVTFNVKQWLGTEFVYPNDFVSPMISAAPAFNLAPGASTIVKAKWPAAMVPPAGTHGCLLVSVYTPREHTPAGRHAWEHPNLGQKNMTVIAASPDQTLSVPFRFGNRLRIDPQLFRLELRQASPRLKLALAADPTVLKSILAGPTAATLQPRLPLTRIPTASSGFMMRGARTSVSVERSGSTRLAEGWRNRDITLRGG